MCEQFNAQKKAEMNEALTFCEKNNVPLQKNDRPRRLIFEGRKVVRVTLTSAPQFVEIGGNWVRRMHT